MKIEKIKQLLEEIIKDKSIEIFSIKTKREFGENILEILVNGENITTDILEPIHLELQEKLTDDIFDPNYYLEISTVGVERPLVSEDDFNKAIGKYIFITSSRYKGFGDLVSIENNIVVVKINEKGRFKKIEIPYDDISISHIAIKF